MANLFESMIRENRDPQVEQLKELVAFSTGHNIDSRELSLAYKIAMNCLSDKDASGKPREEVYELAKKMDELMNDGLSANNIIHLIESEKDHESLCDNYYALVDSLLINEKGKKLLKSIVEKKRTGNLTIIAGGEEMEINIPPEAAENDNTQKKLAAELTQYLKKYQNEKIEIMFSE